MYNVKYLLFIVVLVGHTYSLSNNLYKITACNQPYNYMNQPDVILNQHRWCMCDTLKIIFIHQYICLCVCVLPQGHK